MNDKLIIEKVKQLKETAINNQSNWQFPNEHYIEATGMIIALNEVLSVLESSNEQTEEGETEIIKSTIKRLEILGKDICDESLIDDDVSGGYMPQPEGSWSDAIWSIIDNLEKIKFISVQSSEPDKPKDKVTTEDSLANFEKLIDKFFTSNSRKEIERILSKYDKMRFEGLTVEDYFAQQFKSKEVTDEGLRVTDEEIENWAANFCNKYDSSEYGYGDMLIEGAKAMRDGKI
jgi:hypothetical protein